MNKDAGAIDDGLKLGGCEVVEIIRNGGLYFTGRNCFSSEDFLTVTINFSSDKADDERFW